MTNNVTKKNHIDKETVRQIRKIDKQPNRNTNKEDDDVKMCQKIQIIDNFCKIFFAKLH